MFNHFKMQIYLISILQQYSGCFHGYSQKVVKSTHNFAFYES